MSQKQMENKQNKQKKLQDEKEGSDNEFIGHYVEAPTYMKDNQHITHGYRIGFNSPKKIFRSLFMVHNQLINIWTHFFPAVLIICLLAYLMYSLGSNQLLHQFQTGKQRLSIGIQTYTQALDQYAVVMKMKQFTTSQIKQIQTSLLDSYNNFVQATEEWKNSTGLAVSDIGHSLKKSAQSKVHQMERVKVQFQKVYVPYFLNQLLVKIDPEKLLMIKQKLQRLKSEIDSEHYEYVQFLHNKYEDSAVNKVSRWPLLVFLGSAITCLLCSTTFHLFYPMSGRAYQVFCRLDYAGINILISGSAFPPLYYGMYCCPNLAAFYLIFIVLIGSTLFVLSLFQYLHRPENFVIKSLAYGGFGVSLAIPLTHAVINQLLFNNYGDNFSIVSSIDEYICCGASYLFGLYIYTIRCPERNRPGKYNICGHSHQIWHCLVVLGIICTYLGAIQNLQTRRYSSCAAIEPLS